MKRRCEKCGSERFLTGVAFSAHVTSDYVGDPQLIGPGEDDRHVPEITGDLQCSGCDRCYDKWEDIPEAPDEDEDEEVA